MKKIFNALLVFSLYISSLSAQTTISIPECTNCPSSSSAGGTGNYCFPDSVTIDTDWVNIYTERTNPRNVIGLKSDGKIYIIGQSVQIGYDVPPDNNTALLPRRTGPVLWQNSLNSDIVKVVFDLDNMPFFLKSNGRLYQFHSRNGNVFTGNSDLSGPSEIPIVVPSGALIRDFGINKTGSSTNSVRPKAVIIDTLGNAFYGVGSAGSFTWQSISKPSGITEFTKVWIANLGGIFLEGLTSGGEYKYYAGGRNSNGRLGVGHAIDVNFSSGIQPVLLPSDAGRMVYIEGTSGAVAFQGEDNRAYLAGLLASTLHYTYLMFPLKGFNSQTDVDTYSWNPIHSSSTPLEVKPPGTNSGISAFAINNGYMIGSDDGMLYIHRFNSQDILWGLEEAGWPISSGNVMIPYMEPIQTCLYAGGNNRPKIIENSRDHSCVLTGEGVVYYWTNNHSYMWGSTAQRQAFIFNGRYHVTPVPIPPVDTNW